MTTVKYCMKYDTACWAPRLSLSVSLYTLSLSNETAVDFVQRERPLHVRLRVQSTVKYVGLRKSPPTRIHIHVPGRVYTNIQAPER